MGTRTPPRSIRLTLFAFFKRISTWLVLLAAFQLLSLAMALVTSSFSYMGASDLKSLNLALSMYSGDIQRLISRIYVYNLLVMAVLSWPLAALWFSVKGISRPIKLLVFGAGIGLVHFCWVALACIRVPSLFSEIYYRDGTGFPAYLMRWVCSYAGIATVLLCIILLLLLTAKLCGPRIATVALAFYLSVGVLLYQATTYHPSLNLPQHSVVLLVADSLRSDYWQDGRLPKLARLAQTDQPVVIKSVIPPVARTTPAIVSLLTGKLPIESGVTTMFSSEETFRQIPSVVSYYRNAGYCTIVSGEYPAEMFRKYDFGFEIVDAPLVRFKEIAQQLVLTKSPFVLASLSWMRLPKRMGRGLRDLFEGLPIFASPRGLLRNFENSVKRCGGRPVFAFVFADQPHFPYVQTWPFYLQENTPYRGPYKYVKDPTSTPTKAEDKAQIRILYENGLKSTDDAFGDLLQRLSARHQLEQSTVILTGDHGESLYDNLGIMGHGDQIGEMEGISVPWVVWGAGKALFSAVGDPVESIQLPRVLLELNHIPNEIHPSLPKGMLYVETDLWLASTPNVPSSRIHYPELSEVLMLKNPEAHLELNPIFSPIVEFAKHRLWIIDGVRYSIEPTPSEVAVRINGKPATAKELPAPVRNFIQGYYPSVAPAFLH